MIRVITCLAAVVAGVISLGPFSSAAVSSDAAISAEGVSALTYGPKPFTDALSRMRVRFTTTGPARPGYYYDVYVFVDRLDGEGGCLTLGVSNATGAERRMIGASDHVYTVWLTGIKASSRTFCPGKAELTVVSRPIGSASTRCPNPAHDQLSHSPRVTTTDPRSAEMAPLGCARCCRCTSRSASRSSSCASASAVLGFVAYRRDGERGAFVSHALVLAQTLLIAQAAVGLLLLSDGRRAPEKLHYTYGALALGLALTPWFYAPGTGPRRLLWFAVTTLVAGALAVRAFMSGS